MVEKVTYGATSPLEIECISSRGDAADLTSLGFLEKGSAGYRALGNISMLFSSDNLSSMVHAGERKLWERDLLTI